MVRLENDAAMRPLHGGDAGSGRERGFVGGGVGSTARARATRGGAETGAAVEAGEHADRKGMWSALGEALRGTHADLTEAPLSRAIVLLGVPMVLEMAMESVFALVDVFVVSRLGADAVATVGLTEAFLSLVYAVAVGLGMGATAVVARRMGEKDAEGAATASVQAIGLAVLASVPAMLVGALWVKPLLAGLGGSAWVLEHGASYARVMLVTDVVIVEQFVISAVFRAAGDAVTAMRVLWLGNGINIVLSPCLALGLGPFPRLGMTGAALATVIGRGTAVLCQLVLLSRPGRRLRVHRRTVRFDAPSFATILRLGASATGQYLVSTSSWVVMVRILSVFGSPVVAGYTIAMRLVQFALMPSWGLSNAAATLVGQNLGAGRPDRAEQVVWRAALYNVVFLGALTVVFVGGATAMVRSFTVEPEVLAQGVRCLEVVGAGFVFYALGMVMSQSLNGAGDTTTPMLLNLGCFWLFELPLAYGLAIPLRTGPFGGYLAITAAFSAVAVLGTLVFRRGKWKLQKV